MVESAIDGEMSFFGSVGIHVKRIANIDCVCSRGIAVHVAKLERKAVNPKSLHRIATRRCPRGGSSRVVNCLAVVTRTRPDECQKQLAIVTGRRATLPHRKGPFIAYLTSQIAPPTTTTIISTVKMPAPARSAVLIGVLSAAGSVEAVDPALGSLLEVAPVRSDNGIRP